MLAVSSGATTVALRSMNAIGAGAPKASRSAVTMARDCRRTDRYRGVIVPFVIPGPSVAGRRKTASSRREVRHSANAFSVVLPDVMLDPLRNGLRRRPPACGGRAPGWRAPAPSRSSTPRDTGARSRIQSFQRLTAVAWDTSRGECRFSNSGTEISLIPDRVTLGFRERRSGSVPLSSENPHNSRRRRARLAAQHGLRSLLPPIACAPGKPWMSWLPEPRDDPAVAPPFAGLRDIGALQKLRAGSYVSGSALQAVRVPHRSASQHISLPKSPFAAVIASLICSW